jgi:hypothetical protein
VTTHRLSTRDLSRLVTDPSALEERVDDAERVDQIRLLEELKAAAAAAQARVTVAFAASQRAVQADAGLSANAVGKESRRRRAWRSGTPGPRRAVCGLGRHPGDRAAGHVHGAATRTDHRVAGPSHTVETTCGGSSSPPERLSLRRQPLTVRGSSNAFP